MPAETKIGEIKVPQLGESVVEATIARWLKKEGDAVNAGEPVVELETDKVNVEVPAEQSGVLQSITGHEGDTVNVGSVLALVAESGAASVKTNGSAPNMAPPAPNSGGAGKGEARDEEAPPPAPVHDSSTPATPLAARVAEAQGIDLQAVSGSGPGGRVTRDDITRSLQTPPTASERFKPLAPAPVAPPPLLRAGGSSTRPEDRVKMSRRRQTIATRLVDAQHTAAMLTTFNEIDMGAVMDIRARRKDSFKEKNGVGLGFMSFFTKASIGALKAFPLLNAEIQGLEIVKKGYYDIGIAVGAEEGLVVPVVRDADKLTFAGIEKAIADLAARARANTLTLPELQGGTFTITNGGVFGSLMSTPILNAPQVGILGLHKIEQRPMAKDGQVVIRPMMYVALSYDHRIVDGSEAVRFLVRIKELMEDPESLLLEG